MNGFRRLGEKARLEIMKDTAHVPQVEDPEQFNAILLNFLLGTPRSGVWILIHIYDAWETPSSNLWGSYRTKSQLPLYNKEIRVLYFPTISCSTKFCRIKKKQTRERNGLYMVLGSKMYHACERWYAWLASFPPPIWSEISIILDFFYLRRL